MLNWRNTRNSVAEVLISSEIKTSLVWKIDSVGKQIQTTSTSAPKTTTTTTTKTPAF
jgi:hypothetical protein